eukprot:CAMPEP_0201544914 /NCGR_PEP_ID=MMETSP0173_2-20130828/1531_1 /ASSEMBLY_ACC=CAM_ASM_000268 /TAXON_ID=218659 /ORGANISM="Vexillifera sp., Strain DIVA3 564/2" /LENGTH=63 /DNA_ID=CAMNT_0047953197 /DNA_START=49 /DNA_END=240 /DNA_ORIENTATION=+
MGKVHGGLARAGKVKNNTPKVEPMEGKAKAKVGRAKKRFLYNRRFQTKVEAGGRRKGPNSQDK